MSSKVSGRFVFEWGGRVGFPLSNAGWWVKGWMEVEVNPFNSLGEVSGLTDLLT